MMTNKLREKNGNRGFSKRYELAVMEILQEAFEDASAISCFFDEKI
jgi:hypothetical protein